MGSGMEANRILECPVLVDYRPMICASLSEQFDKLLSMTNPLPRMTGSKLPMCTTALRNDGLGSSPSPSPHYTIESKYADSVLYFQNVDPSRS